MFLQKDGITIEIEHPVEIARYKAAGYKEVISSTEPSKGVATSEEQNAEAIAEVNKPIGSKKAKGEK